MCNINIERRYIPIEDEDGKHLAYEGKNMKKI